jgi:hypothetical protein
MNRPACVALLSLGFWTGIVPAFAADSWDCTFARVSGSAKGSAGIAKIHIDGNTLNWLLPPPYATDTRNKWTTFPYRLLENNDVGIVAVTTEARVYEGMGSLYNGIGPVVGATIIILNKSNGDFHTGSVMANGAHDLLSGRCKLE